MSWNDLTRRNVDSSFTDWLFVEAAKGAPGSDESVQAGPSSSEPTEGESIVPIEVPPHIADSSRRASTAARNGIYQQAISQAIPSASTGQKRRADGRSPSPSPPNKSRRMDLPTAPRAMQHSGGVPQASSRSLLDRVGGPAGRNTAASGTNQKHDEIQARIDNIVNNAPESNMLMAGGFPMNGMEMNPMAAANMGNPLMLQEMMMNQMALMAQMASSMGMLNPATGQFVAPAFPMQGVMPPDMGMFQGGMNNPMQVPIGMVNGRGRGGGRGGRGSGRGRSGPTSTSGPTTPKSSEVPVSEIPSIPTKQPIFAAPTPTLATPTVPIPSIALTATATPQQRIPYAVPERPQSPTLCKYGLKCTNAHCRYSHPSPVATPESGVVLSNEACEKGKDCKDKDCIKAHISPAALNAPGRP